MSLPATTPATYDQNNSVSCSLRRYRLYERSASMEPSDKRCFSNNIQQTSSPSLTVHRRHQEAENNKQRISSEREHHSHVRAA